MNKLLERIHEDRELGDYLDMAFALEELAKIKDEARIPSSFPKKLYITYHKDNRYSLEPCDTGNDWLLIVPGHGFAIIPELKMN